MSEYTNVEEDEETEKATPIFSSSGLASPSQLVDVTGAVGFVRRDTSSASPEALIVTTTSGT